MHYWPPEEHAPEAEQVGWCANYVSVCPPPPVVSQAGDSALYLVRQDTVSRATHYSKPTENLNVGDTRTFVWDLSAARSVAVLEYGAPDSFYPLAGVVSPIVYSPSYAELFVGMTRVHLEKDDEARGGFHVAVEEVRPLARG